MVEVLVEHTWRFFNARSALTESSKLGGAASGLAQSSESAGEAPSATRPSSCASNTATTKKREATLKLGTRV
jgi:hypothetical protein